ncbi:class IV lanthionine synthetase LanL [Nonomuraea typhae]|uniref:Class IV lanthionine synthetase LanL n=1 Tax=Nonomuraea typhae TaxID=2603600 RepID=A0ABW7YUR3_9ACTN
MRDKTLDDALLDQLQGVLAEVTGAEQWDVRPDAFWCHVEPPGYGWRLQGWKLHVSATVESAPSVLVNAARALLSRRARFKFARSLGQVAELTSMRYPRAGGGKFITVYPDDDEHFLLLAAELHHATEGLTGPVILSDRPYCSGSLVHYRYGAFTTKLARLDDDGSYVSMLMAPNGTWEEDRRAAWFTPPPWAPPPLPPGHPSGGLRETNIPILIAGRFAVDAAIRHSNRGGVYRAIDREDDRRVILKEARPFIANAQKWLRHEAEMLDALEPTGLTPRKIGLFDYEGHLFLAQEEMSGPTLRRWFEDESRDAVERRPAPTDALEVAGRLVDLLTTVHSAGFVLRDFNPGNVLIMSDGTLRLIDVEFTARPGEHVLPVVTPGYTAPEQAEPGQSAVTAAQQGDLYSLGASLLYVCSGINPTFPPDDAPGRLVDERMDLLVRTAANGNDALRRLAPLILGLTAADPEARWSLERAHSVLRQGPTTEPTLISVLTSDEQERLLEDLLCHILESMTPGERYPWPPLTYEARVADPCGVHAGVAGVVAVLSHAARVLQDERYRVGLATAAGWLSEELWHEPRILPGMFFGRSGAAWALYDAARTLADDNMADRALTYAKRIPLRWPVPDFTHGVAGSGVAQLALWQATGDTDFRARAEICTDWLLESSHRRGSDITWPIPESIGSKLGGLTHYGFAHGVAGIATFLLAAGEALGRTDCTETALACGTMLHEKAKLIGDTARWPVGPHAAEHTDGPAPETAWWCSGAGGIGAFLIRLWRVTGEARFRELAERAATAVRNERWLLSHVHCHGNSGNGELLLDLAAVLEDGRFRNWAEEMATCIHSAHVYRNGRMVIPHQVTPEQSYGYNLGLAGVAGFLLRLRHGGRRWFMPDDFFLTPPDERAG